MDFTQTRLSLRRDPLSYSKVRAVAGPLFRAWPRRQTPEAGAYLNVGAGPHGRDGFFNIDYDYHPGIQMFWDLSNPLPIRSDMIGGIFTEHCLEHLPFETGKAVLKDFCRILMPGRTVRISVPDGEIFIRSYAEGRPMPFAAHETRDDPDWTPMQSINRTFYGHGHRFIYDFATMRRCLAEAGFENIRKEEFGSGRDQKLLIDQESRRVESLYVEASKPA